MPFGKDVTTFPISRVVNGELKSEICVSDNLGRFVFSKKAVKAPTEGLDWLSYAVGWGRSSARSLIWIVQL